MPSMTHYQRKYSGDIIIREVYVEDIIATRPFVHANKVDRYRVFEGDYRPSGIVETNEGLLFLVDGHHKTKANHLNGNDTIVAQVLINSKKRLYALLERRTQCQIHELLLR